MLEKLKRWCKRSEVIVMARVQVLLGIAGSVIMWVVNSPEINDALKTILKPEFIPFYIIAIGGATEYLRTRRTTVNPDGSLKGASDQ